MGGGGTQQQQQIACATVHNFSFPAPTPYPPTCKGVQKCKTTVILQGRFSFSFKGVLHPYLKSACFVCYLKTVNTFLKNNTCILKQIVHGTQSRIAFSNY